MFTAELSCETWGPITGKFVVGFVPYLDSVDVVLQDAETYSIRVITCDGIANKQHARQSEATAEEELFESIISDFVAKAAKPNERKIAIGFSPDAFKPVPCPKCRSESVRLHLLSLI